VERAKKLDGVKGRKNAQGRDGAQGAPAARALGYRGHRRRGDGVGVAVDAASRGFDVVLVEAHDFWQGNQQRSTKLVHGGVRYLEQGDVPLVMSALKERGLLRQNAPHLVHDLAFVVPRYSWWQAPFYGIGLKLYDLLAGK